MTARVRATLSKRASAASTLYVFAGAAGRPYVGTYLDRVHKRVRDTLKLPKDFVLHSFRHTMLTRLGETGTDAFTIMKIAGHSSVTVSEKYVHPTPETMEKAFERLEALHGGGTNMGTVPESPNATVVVSPLV